MQSDQKEKQQYLFQEIIEKNYDPEQFQDFLTSAKESGDDLQNWSLPELKEAVRKFQRQFEKSGEELKEDDQRATIEKNEMIQEFLEAEEKSPVKGKPEIFEEIDYENPNEIFLKKVECLPQSASALLSAKSPQVTVTKFEKR